MGIWDTAENIEIISIGLFVFILNKFTFGTIISTVLPLRHIS